MCWWPCLEVPLSFKVYWREATFLIVLLKVGPSLSLRLLILMTLGGFFGHLVHFVHRLCAIAIAKTSPLLFVEAFTDPSQRCSDRFKMFSRGEWLQLLVTSRACDEKAATARNRRRRRPPDDLERRANKALLLVQMANSPPRGKLLRERRLHLVHTRLCKR